jgi:hypothetical protein
MVEKGKAYRLYAKGPNPGERFHPVDWQASVVVRLLIHATIFVADSEDKVENMNAAIADLRDSNPGWAFEYREVPGW